MSSLTTAPMSSIMRALNPIGVTRGELVSIDAAERVAEENDLREVE